MASDKFKEFKNALDNWSKTHNINISDFQDLHRKLTSASIGAGLLTAVYREDYDQNISKIEKVITHIMRAKKSVKEFESWVCLEELKRINRKTLAGIADIEVRYLGAIEKIKRLKKESNELKNKWAAEIPMPNKKVRGRKKSDAGLKRLIDKISNIYKEQTGLDFDSAHKKINPSLDFALICLKYLGYELGADAVRKRIN